MKIYTRRGDRGDTDLAGGGRVGKDDPRVEAYGAVDELNAFVGIAAVEALPESAPLLERIQRTLFRIGAALATNPDAEKKALAGIGATDDDVAELEAGIDTVDTELSALRAFVLPGGTRAAAAFHAARTVCRRAERRVLSLERLAPLPDASVRYLNRLSDLLFVLARQANHRAGVGDVEWTGRDG
ncbi:MAG: cob(I)yrinic acid a,c-diamide adenosyltransferase [Deltaproteobacteria bacterium]|nr:cob(I)yrinic acid a,c-diamide adenosyltransferase [Deltaproteobacteria bacterium]MBW2384055.1 cob(I)yrinic acid a,c-diamide adenosyltransferase [Deltaproteobacteria bacterium]